MPDTPSSDRAARTSSSLKGLMIALISFMDFGLLGSRVHCQEAGRGPTSLETETTHTAPPPLGGTSDCLCRIRADLWAGRILNQPVGDAHHNGALMPSTAHGW